jgi:uracil DNA glycosylase
MMEKRMNFQTFEEPLGDWAPKLKPFIEGEEMWDLYQKIKADSKTDMIVPRSPETFRAFKSCRLADLKVVFFLQDPYPRLYKNGVPQACGIAMDCRNSPDGKIQPSLELWYDAVDRYLQGKDYQLPDGYGIPEEARIKHGIPTTIKKAERTGNLDYLHEQGVILLNTDLTCKMGKTGSHEGYWRPFHKYLLSEVLGSHTGMIYVLCGKTSHTMEEFINPLGNYIFKVEHPMAAGHRGDDIWRDDNIFAKINKLLIENHGKQYQVWWDRGDWEFFKDPPF